MYERDEQSARTCRRWLVCDYSPYERSYKTIGWLENAFTGRNNHKYRAPHLITIETLTNAVYTPSQFPSYPENLSQPKAEPATGKSRASTSKRSQSEHDWAYALRAIARGDEPEEVTRAIATYRPDKSNPLYYAQHTVEKALAALNRTGEYRHVTAARDPER